MPVHIQTDGVRLEIRVRQGVGSLVAFVAMVVVIGVAASSRGRAVGDSAWIWWPVGLGLVAIVWSIYALSAEECYMFDASADSFELRRRSVLGVRSAASGRLVDLLAAQASWIGYDDSVRGITLTRRAESPLTLPLRSTGLSAGEQSQIATAIDDVLRAERFSHVRGRALM